MLRVKGLSVTMQGKEILRDVSFDALEGQWLMLAGPNGAGKSTLLRAISQGLIYEGKVLFEGQDLKAMRPRDRARRMALLSQMHEVGYAFTALELVRLGRYAYGGFLKGRDEEGEAQIAEAIRLTGLDAIATQNVLTLSGGELQRVFLAQVLAQSPRLLLLDEPANHLDIKYQQQIFGIIESWLKAPGRAVISVVHDLSLARRFGHQALLLDKGRAVAHGGVRDVLSRDRLKAVYGVDVFHWMRTLLGGWQDDEEEST